MSSYPHRATSRAASTSSSSRRPPLAARAGERRGEDVAEEKKPAADDTGEGPPRTSSSRAADEARSRPTPGPSRKQTAAAGGQEPGARQEGAAARHRSTSRRSASASSRCPSPRATTSGSSPGKANTLFIIEPPGPGAAAGAGPPPGATVHQFDLEKRKLDKVLDNIRGFDLSANGEKMLYRQGEGWFIAATAAMGTPAFQPRRGAHQDRRHGGPRRPARRVAADVPRGLAHRARLLLRPRTTTASTCSAAEKKYEPYLASRHAPRRPELPLPGDARRAVASATSTCRAATRPTRSRVPGGLLGADYTHRERPLPLRPHLQRRELEPAAARAAHAARRQRPGGRVPAGRQRPRADGHRQHLLVLRGHGRQADRCIKVGPNADGGGRARGDGRAGRQRDGLAQPRLDRRQPPQGRPDDRRQGGLRLPARHGRPAATPTSTATSSRNSTSRRPSSTSASTAAARRPITSSTTCASR